MLPKLLDFGIHSPVYLRKIDRLSHWNPESSSSEDRVNKVAEKIFRDQVCSIWYIKTDEEFYGMVAAISAKRNPRHQDIDFIYLTEEDLENCQILKEQTKEGGCLLVERLHYNILINEQQAKKLCRKLLEIAREPKRCKRKTTQLILEFQEKRGCKAIDETHKKCDCEH